MKTFMNKIFVLLAISVFLGSCEDTDLTVLNPSVAVTATLSESEVVLETANLGQEALTVSWTVNDYGYSAAPNYQLLIDLAEGDFSAAKVISTGSGLSKTFETEELNKILIGLGVEPDTETAIAIKVKSILGSSTTISSATSPLMATAYADALDLSSPWGVVGSAYNNWGATPDAPFYQVQGSPNVYVAYVTLLDGEWKIRKDNAWDVNYGDDGADGTLEAGGANIVATAGTYKIVFDEAALTYTIEAYTWGIVGSAYNDWGNGGPDAALAYDPFTDTWRAQVKLEDGLFKIRLNNDWTTSYGDGDDEGSLDAGGTDIPVSSGYYEIIVDFNDLTYTLEETDVYGVVGSGYNDWGATPDFPFVKDFEKEGVYHAINVTLLDGHIKFRVNNDWATDYGDTGLDGILDLAGDNIPSTAGAFDITLDFSNPDEPVYTMTAR